MRSKHTRERAWTPVEEADLRAWYEGGLDYHAIGLRLNRGWAGVKSKVQKSGFQRSHGRQIKPWTEWQLETLKRMWSENRSTPAIVQAIGRSQTSIYGKTNDLGLKPRDFGKAKKAVVETPKMESAWVADNESVAAKLRELATARFLIDFKRAGYTAAHYKAHCEVHPAIVASEPCLRFNEQPLPKHADYQTSMGSTSAMCAEMSQ